MKSGRLLAAILIAATLVFIAIGTIWPGPTALIYAGAATVLRPSSTPEIAVQNLGDQIRAQAWQKAYDSLANKGEFTQQQFQHDLIGYSSNLLSYATVASFDVRPLHANDTEADMNMKFHWATVVGNSVTERKVHVVRDGSKWVVQWPITKQPVVPPQVINVNYLRWDVIYPGGADDWGANEVESPHTKIVDMHPVERAEGVVILGELLNEDVVPAYVNVSATLLSKTHATIATENSFDKISHLLLPKAVTPFLISFPGVSMSEVGSIRMDQRSALIAASADPVILLANEQLNPSPDPSLTGQLINQSGQTVNVAHVLGTFYDRSGNVVWVADQYVDQALLPQVPVPFRIHIPEDLSKDISNQRTVVSTYSIGGPQ